MIKTDDGKTQLYQLSCTYYSALRCNDNDYLLARAIQFFTPGIPQVYYVGMLAGENDTEALKRGEEPRSINRHTYSEEEIAAAVEKKVVKKLFKLMEFRNNYPAFNGNMDTNQVDGPSHDLRITWRKDNYQCTLQCNMHAREFSITYYDPVENTIKNLEEL